MEPAQTNSKSIDISVAVPVQNEAASVGALLYGLLTQTLKPAEIVITDSGSTDDTTGVIEGFIKDGAPVKLIRERPRLPGGARNIAVDNARCDWIAFTDAGITQAPDWLANLALKVEEDSAVDVVYGNYAPVTDTFFTECAAIVYVQPPSDVDGEYVRPPSIASALMRRKVWETVGGFPEDLRSAEDLLFMRQIERAGFKIVRTAAAAVYWNIQPGFWGTFKRFTAYSRSNIRAGLFGEWQGRIFIYYAIIGASAFSKAAQWGPRSLLIPPVLWLLMLAARGAKALYQNRRAYPAGLFRNVARLLLIVPIIAVLDAATFAGAIIWLLNDKLKLTGSRGQDESR